MKYEIQRTGKFKKDYKLAQKRGWDLGALRHVIELLANGKTLPEEYYDHILTNSRNYKNMRECHVAPDWLLVYKITDTLMILSLERTGTHSDLF